MTKSGMPKSEFARVMGVDRAQPTRWASEGMPVLPDGTIDAGAAAEWVRANVDQTQRQRRSIGADEIRRGSMQRQNEDVDALIRCALRLAVAAAPTLAARAAADAGLTAKQQAAVHEAACVRAPQLEAGIRRMMDVPAGEAPPLNRVNHPLELEELAT